MTGMTWFMVGIVFIWTAIFLALTVRDLKCEAKKEEVLSKGEDLDPYLFSGEKARAEARDAYLNNDPVLKPFFEELGIVKFLGIEDNK